jgi:hypothetical protein
MLRINSLFALLSLGLGLLACGSDPAGGADSAISPDSSVVDTGVDRGASDGASGERRPPDGPSTDLSPPPDSATPTPDSATPTPDSATPTPDSATPTPDSATPTPDSATPTPDSATPTPDSATPTPDSASPTPDSATPAPDSATPDSAVVDSALPVPDMATPDLLAPDLLAPDLLAPDLLAPDVSTQPDSGGTGGCTSAGGGFTAAPAAFALPPYVTQYKRPFGNSYEASSYCSSSAGNRPRYRVFDIDGDARPDVVLSYDCVDQTIGDTRWLVYKNLGNGFAQTPTVFALPPYVTQYKRPFGNSYEASSYCSSSAGNRPRYRVFDIDGDARPDVVLSYDCVDQTIGDTRWLVYKNLGNGFAQTPTVFALPPYVTQYKRPFGNSYEASSYCSSSAGNRPRYRVFDIDGDARPDVVLSYDCVDQTVGDTRWLVYKNLGNGFAQTPTVFALPPYATKYKRPFGNSYEASSYCPSSAGNRPRYRVFDIDGDARPDVVLSYDCVDQTIGDTRWVVYKNLGSGYAQTPTAFALPPYATKYKRPFGNSYEASSYCSSSAGNRPRYRVFDIDGDTRPDMVLSYDCVDQTLGDTQWVVYVNNGAGFSQSARCWALPQYATTYKRPFGNSYEASSYCSSSAGNRPRYRVFDINGDAKPDVVLSYDCVDQTVGDTHWLVHPGL